MNKYTVIGYHNDAQCLFAEWVEAETPKEAIQTVIRDMHEEHGCDFSLLEYAGGLTVLDALKGHVECCCVHQYLSEGYTFFDEEEATT
jgi:hypothetical protein